MVSQDEKQRFEKAAQKIIGIERERQGIGTLSEKTVHAILKNYYSTDPDTHEIPIENYVADIYTGKEIIEVQTGNFNKLRGKLQAFLPLYPVTIVYPIPNQKWLIWIDEESGELTNKRKSPVTGNIYSAFVEMYKIKMFLKDPNLSFRLVLLDMEEYRILNGWSQDKKKGSSRYDRLPKELVEELIVERVEDYIQFLPYDLPGEFTSKEFAKHVKIRINLAQTVLQILFHVGAVRRIGKKGNSFVYEVAVE